MRRLEALSVAGFHGILVALSIFTVVDLDIGFHLAAGAYIAETGSIPTRDLFSFIAEGRPWIDSHWLYQVVVHHVYELSGAPGLVAMRTGLVLATFSLLLAASRERAGVIASLLVGLIAVFIGYQRFIVRPELFTMLFLAGFMYGADKLPRHPQRCFVILPVVQAIWVNMHGLWVLGIGYLAMRLAGGVAQDLTHRRWPAFPAANAEPGARAKEAWLLVACSAAALANANGLDGILYPLSLLSELAGGVPWFPRLLELEPPLTYPVRSPLDPGLFFRILLVLFPLSAVANYRRVRLSDLLPAFVFMLLSLRAYRNIPLFAIVAMPVTAANLRGALRGAVASGWVRPPDARTVAVVTSASIGVLLLVLIAGVTSNRLYTSLDWPRRFGVTESPYYPAGIVEPLRALEGRFFNDSSMGGYLIWKLYPDKQVSADGRWEVYGERLLELNEAMRGPRKFSAFAKEYDIVAVALLRKHAESRLMRRWLKHSREFKLSVQTPYALLYEKVERGEPDRAPQRGGTAFPASPAR